MIPLHIVNLNLAFFVQDFNRIFFAKILIRLLLYLSWLSLPIPRDFSAASPRPRSRQHPLRLPEVYVHIKYHPDIPLNLSWKEKFGQRRSPVYQGGLLDAVRVLQKRCAVHCRVIPAYAYAWPA